MINKGGINIINNNNTGGSNNNNNSGSLNPTFVDGRIVWKYVSMDKITQSKIALAVDTTPDVLINHLLWIY